MKKLVGKRETPIDPGLRAMISVASMCATGRPIYASRVFYGSCEKCDRPVKIEFTEDIKTGEIWLEGPDNCAGCGHQLVVNKLPDTQLSQEGIRKLFGAI